MVRGASAPSLFTRSPCPVIRDPGDAVTHRRAMHASTDPTDVLAADVAERLAIRDPEGEWTVQRHTRAVRLFLKAGEDHVSKYIWAWKDTDDVIDYLLSVKRRTKKRPPHP